MQLHPSSSRSFSGSFATPHFVWLGLLYEAGTTTSGRGANGVATHPEKAAPKLPGWSISVSGRGHNSWLFAQASSPKDEPGEEVKNEAEADEEPKGKTNTAEEPWSATEDKQTNLRDGNGTINPPFP